MQALVKITVFVCLFFRLSTLSAQNDLVFSQLDSLLSYSETHSVSIRTAQPQAMIAKLGKITAYINALNLRMPLNAAMTDNTQLPINFIPAEVFGGPAGTFRQLTFGQPYITNASFTPQIDLINLAAWSRVKSAELNEQLTETNNKLNKKLLFESIAFNYFNIISLQEQVRIVERNGQLADTILMIVKNKFEQGIVRKQEVNEALINQINWQEKQKQLALSLEQQYNVLKMLCDIPMTQNLRIEQQFPLQFAFDKELRTETTLKSRQSQLQAQMAKEEIRFYRWGQLPTVSLVGNWTWQQNSTDRFFSSTAATFNSTYIGLRLNFNLIDPLKMAQSRNANVNYQLASMNAKHTQLQNNIDNSQLRLDYEKAFSQWNSGLEITKLREENYQSSQNQYEQSILPLDKLLLSFNDVLNSRLNLAISSANLLYSQSKIEINNRQK
jgi:outer membrane protein TolC